MQLNYDALSCEADTNLWTTEPCFFFFYYYDFASLSLLLGLAFTPTKHRYKLSAFKAVAQLCPSYAHLLYALLYALPLIADRERDNINVAVLLKCLLCISPLFSAIVFAVSGFCCCLFFFVAAAVPY